MTKEEKAVKFVEDFIKYGFRIDVNPTIIIVDSSKPFDAHNWWSDYVSNAEKRLIDEAKEVFVEEVNYEKVFMRRAIEKLAGVSDSEFKELCIKLNLC